MGLGQVQEEPRLLVPVRGVPPRLLAEVVDLGALIASTVVIGWPKRCKLAHAFLQEYSDKRLKLAQLLGQLGVFLT